MIRRGLFVRLVVTSLLVAASAMAQEPKAEYTVPEYNAYRACVAEANAAAKLTCFGSFEATYPQSTLLPFPYVYWQAFQAAAASNNWAKITEYADKVTALGEKVDVLSRFTVCYARANAFHSIFNARAANAAELATKARASVEECLALAGKLTKPETVEQGAFDQYVIGAKTLLNYTIGVASAALKDYKKAVEGFENALVSNPNDALIRYQLGVNRLQLDPPQYMDGFWSLARAINLKVAGEARVRAYLRGQMAKYQGGFVQCDKEIDAQMAELLALAGSSNERPADYKIPSGGEIEAVQKQINILTMLKGLKEGGATAKTTWLASCGLEFPEVLGKVISAADNGSGPVIQVFTGDDPDTVEKATVHNLEVHVADQPEAARVKKDEPVRFSGHVARYSPEPFTVFFDKGKVNSEDIPAVEKAQPKKAPPKKAPAKKAAKRPPAR